MGQPVPFSVKNYIRVRDAAQKAASLRGLRVGTDECWIFICRTILQKMECFEHSHYWHELHDHWSVELESTVRGMLTGANDDEA